MSASEIIAHIKALPPEERSEVIAFVLQLESKPQGEARPIDDEELASVAEHVFNCHDDLFRKLAQ